MKQTITIRNTHFADYERFGFVHMGESASTHGGAAWHEMALTL
jgi:hypothetical protein